MSDFELIMGTRKGGSTYAEGYVETRADVNPCRYHHDCSADDASGGTALAHYTQIYHGSDTAWVTADHLTLGVQDNECDGHRVFAQIWTSDFSFYWAFYDANDCAPGASFFTTYNSDILINRYRLCEESEGCTSIMTR
jgi:hypothetical protein